MLSANTSHKMKRELVHNELDTTFEIKKLAYNVTGYGHYVSVDVGNHPFTTETT